MKFIVLTNLFLMLSSDVFSSELIFQRTDVATFTLKYFGRSLAVSSEMAGERKGYPCYYKCDNKACSRIPAGYKNPLRKKGWNGLRYL